MGQAAFRLWGADHIAVLLMISVLGIATVRASPKLRGRSGNAVAYALGASLAAYGIAIYATLFATGAFDPAWALPLEFCHWVLIATALALFTGNRTASEIAYFWGIGGTLQAILTPDLSSGFPSWDFLFFFWGHGATMLGILFLVSSERFRPGPGSVGRAFAALNAYAAFAGLVNALTGWNYGYLCRKPGNASLLDYLGPWPWYLLSLEVLALALFALLALPWRRQAARAAPGGGNA